MKVGIGYSSASDSHKAAEEASKEAVSSVDRPILTFLFTTDSYNQEKVFETIRERVGSSKIVGFCCGGIITQRGVLTQGIGVCTMSGNELKAVTSLQRGLSEDSFRVGQRVEEDLLESGIDKGMVFIFPDGFSANISEMVRGLYDRMGPNFDYIGGGGGDNLRFFKTYQWTEKGITSDGVAVALLSGITAQTAIGHGWKPVGEPLTIGNTEGKKVIEIDGKMAFDAYCERLGGIPLDKFPHYGMRYPLGFPNLLGNYLIRDPLVANPDKSITFVTEVPRNAVGYIMEGKVSKLIETAGTIAKMAVEKVAKPQLALCFDCISRYLLMGEEFEKELEAVRKSLGEDIPIFGALTFGEVGSYGKTPLFHNKTFTIAVLGSTKK